MKTILQMKNKFNIISIILIISFLNIISVYADVIVKATVNKNKITIGDKIVYSINISYSQKEKINFPDLGTNLGEFEIKDYKVIGPKTKLYLKKFSIKKKIVTEYQYIITTFTTGEFKIPALTIQYTDEKGVNKEIKSGEISIFVEGVKPNEKDKNDIRDIKAPLSIKINWLIYLIIILTLIFIPISIAGYYYYKNTKREQIFAGTDLNRPPDEVAYERLEKLKSMDLISQGKIKEYYIILSEIMRKYLEHRYSISVLDRTTSELYRELRQIKEIEKKHVTRIKEFLEECDLVKFAKYIPEIEQINKDTDTAKEIIDITKPIKVDTESIKMKDNVTTTVGVK